MQVNIGLVDVILSRSPSFSQLLPPSVFCRATAGNAAFSKDLLLEKCKETTKNGFCCVFVVYMYNRAFVPIRPLSVRLLQIDALIAGHNFLCRWSCLTPLLPLASPTFPLIPHTGDVGQHDGHPEEKTATVLNHAALNDAPSQPPAEEKITREAEHAGLMKL